MASNAIQKYGKAEVMTKIGGRALSSQPPRLQALTSPISVPTAKATMVVTPTSPRVQGKAWQYHRSDGSPEAGGNGNTEVERDHVLPVLEVLADKALVLVAPEQDGEGMYCLRPEVGVLGFEGLAGLPGIEARDEEIEAHQPPTK